MPSPEPSPAPSGPSHARGVAIRALAVTGLLGVVAAGGWLLSGSGEEPATATPVIAGQPGGGAVPSGPSVLQVSSPIKAADPATQGANELTAWAAGLAGPLDIPQRALLGYAKGEVVLRGERPGCQLSWVTLAGLGKASSNHGRFGGGQLNEAGVATRPLGPVPLQGAVTEPAREPRSGPLQLSPGQWQRGSAGIPGADNPNVQDIDDAAVAAGRALCSESTDLGAGRGWWNAIAKYRDSDLFRQQVLGNSQLYATLSLDPARAASPATAATRFALDQLGLPYVWGGNGPEAGAAGFDCSGLTREAYARAGVALPRTAHTQMMTIRPVPLNAEPQLGDLVFYGNPSVPEGIHHVGLYLGNGMMINAPTFGQAVQIHTYHTNGDDYAGAGRPSI